MLLKNVEYLIELEQEILLRPEIRYIDLPFSGRQRIEVYALAWAWYDRLVAYPYGNDEDRLHHFWERCIAEEGQTPSDALVRLVYELIEGYAERGVDITEHDVTGQIAKERNAIWRDRKTLRNGP